MILLILLIAYAAIAPQIPDTITPLFENNIFRIFVILLIAYISMFDVPIAILLAIGFAISMQTIAKQKMNNKLIGLLDNDKLLAEYEDKMVEKMENISDFDMDDQIKSVMFNENDNVYYEDEQEQEEENKFFKFTNNNDDFNNKGLMFDDDNETGWQSYCADDFSGYSNF